MSLEGRIWGLGFTVLGTVVLVSLVTAAVTHRVRSDRDADRLLVERFNDGLPKPDPEELSSDASAARGADRSWPEPAVLTAVVLAVVSGAVVGRLGGRRR
jgi:hypothetical protein